MTDSYLMDADCIHGVVWFDCERCAETMDDRLTAEAAEEIRGELRGIRNELTAIAYSLDQLVKAVYQVGNDRDR